MVACYLRRPLRCLPEALADVRNDPFYDRDVDALARALLSEEAYHDYEAHLGHKERRKAQYPAAPDVSEDLP